MGSDSTCFFIEGNSFGNKKNLKKILGLIIEKFQAKITTDVQPGNRGKKDNSILRCNPEPDAVAISTNKLLEYAIIRIIDEDCIAMYYLDDIRLNGMKEICESLKLLMNGNFKRPIYCPLTKKEYNDNKEFICEVEERYFSFFQECFKLGAALITIQNYNEDQQFFLGYVLDSRMDFKEFFTYDHAISAPSNFPIKQKDKPLDIPRNFPFPFICINREDNSIEIVNDLLESIIEDMRINNRMPKKKKERRINP